MWQHVKLSDVKKPNKQTNKYIKSTVAIVYKKYKLPFTVKFLASLDVSTVYSVLDHVVYKFTVSILFKLFERALFNGNVSD